MAAHDGEISAEFGMRIGKNYQAEIPDLVQDPTRDSNLTRQMASLMWTPNPRRLDAKVDFYLEHAITKFCYSQEQALGLLLWHHHNIDMAIADLRNFAQTPDDWTSEERMVFEQALSRFGKNFNKIHDLMPDKSVGSLVKYYYSWKKSKKPSCPNSKNFSNHSEDVKTPLDNDFQRLQEDQGHRKSMESWMSLRLRARTRVPYDLHLDCRDLKLIARGYSDHMMRQLETELASYKGKVASNKEVLQTMRNNLSDGINQFERPQLPSQPDIGPKWTNTELLLAMQGLRYYGKDFRSVSEMLGSKSEHLVRNLYFNQRMARCTFDSTDTSKEAKLKSLEECKVTQSDAAITMTTNKTYQGQGHRSFLQHSQVFYKETSRGVAEK